MEERLKLKIVYFIAFAPIFLFLGTLVADMRTMKLEEEEKRGLKAE